MPTYQFTYQEFAQENELDPSHAEILSIAKKATGHAYAPYSKFCVGAAVLLGDGKIVTGVNIENASYPVGICAERSALASAISEYPNETIVAIAISYVSPGGANDSPAFPCGMCRQFISECEDRNKKDIVLILAGKTGNIIVVNSSKHLLPFSFSGKYLG
jgi:cytidine deaminase